MFSAELKKPVLKFLKSIKDKTLLKRIADKIDELEKNPFPQKTLKELKATKILKYSE